MAFTQDPGRSPFLKTGHGIPSAFKQMDETDDEFDARGGVEIVGTTKARKALAAKNDLAYRYESAAKRDSTSAANARMKMNIPGDTAEKKLAMAKRAGNKAANNTRDNLGIGYAKVTQFNDSNYGAYNMHLRESNPSGDKYARQYLPERELTYDKKSKKFGSQTLGSNTSIFGNSFTPEKYQKATAMLKK